MNLFNAQITNWQNWSDVYQSIDAFSSLVEHILKKENLPIAKLQNLTPGTNAVFKVGSYVIKIYAPFESGIDQTVDLQTELFAMKRVNELGISAPKMIAFGYVEDKYRFAYMIIEYISGLDFTEAVKTMTNEEKINFGQKLRMVTDNMNVNCDPFNSIDVINDKERCRRWDKYPEKFKSERLVYLKSYDFGEKVFVHGDLCGDNILLTPKKELYIIDFADAVLAPIIYEHALIAVELFEFDLALLYGYFRNYSIHELIEMSFNGLLIHAFGGSIVEQRIGRPSEFQSLDDLREALKHKYKSKICFDINKT